MSAYICDKNHILYLVNSAVRVARRGPHDIRFGWFHGGDWHHLTHMDPEALSEAANMLWRENIKSVSYRYPNESSATLPGPRNPGIITADDFGGCNDEPLSIPQIFKSADCYWYQTCEHPDAEESEALAFIQALRRASWHALPGYEDAEWGAPKPIDRDAIKARIRAQLAA